MSDRWISVNDFLPGRLMIVKWKCIDGVEDIGIYHPKAGEFATIDSRSTKEITHWKLHELAKKDKQVN